MTQTSFWGHDYTLDTVVHRKCIRAPSSPVDTIGWKIFESVRVQKPLSRYAREVSTLFQDSASRPLSLSARLIPLRRMRWIARLWMAAIIVGSLLPGGAKQQLGASSGNAPHLAGLPKLKHRLLHVASFGSSCFLVSLLAINRREELQVAIEVLGVGFLVELAQDVIYSHGKIFEWWDVRDDAIGILAAFVAIQVIHIFSSSDGGSA